MTNYYAMTYIYQDDVEFRCSWDLGCESQGHPTDDELIAHLAQMLSENYEDTWNTFDDELVVNLRGLSPDDFARELVLNYENAVKDLVNSWEFCTNWVVVDPDDYDHPCDL